MLPFYVGPAPFGSSWVKHYCTYRKETKKFTMIPFEHRSGGKVVSIFYSHSYPVSRSEYVSAKMCQVLSLSSSLTLVFFFGLPSKDINLK